LNVVVVDALDASVSLDNLSVDLDNYFGLDRQIFGCFNQEIGCELDWGKPESRNEKMGMAGGMQL